MYQTAIIDNEVVYKILTEHLGDFEQFAVAVARWLERRA